MTLIALTDAEVGGPCTQFVIEPLLTQPHLNIQYLTSRDHTSGCLRALLPVVDVVLLERPRRAETAQARQANRFLDGGGCLAIGEDPRPDLRPLRSPRATPSR